MAIVQISRITNRRGLTENLPQLAGAEFGWCTDSRRLFIGNGTLDEGAPSIGNTEILTEYSDITAYSFYTYEDITVGYAAQTGPTASDPIVRTVQTKLDDFASVRDFGATGDGITDDTAAINRALFQLFCRETNSQIRRSLFFPAGTYKISESLLIPTYAKLVGEGADSTTIQLVARGDDTFADYVAQTTDSLQQTGINIGTNSATAPRNIEIWSMSFRATVPTNIFLIDSATQCLFDSVTFQGNLTQLALEDSDSAPPANVAGLRFAASTLITQQITFDKCAFLNIGYGARTSAACRGVTISNGRFNICYQGVVLERDVDNDSESSPTGWRVVHNMFDVIFAEGIYFDDVSMNASAFNIFYNVGNSVGATSPTAPMITFVNSSSVSVNDMFDRDQDAHLDVPRIRVTGLDTGSGATAQTLGRWSRLNGLAITLTNDMADQTAFELNSVEVRAAQVNYTITRANAVRTGVLTLTTGPDDSSQTFGFHDDYNQSADTGVLLYVEQVFDVISVMYTTTDTGVDAIMTYSITHLA